MVVESLMMTLTWLELFLRCAFEASDIFYVVETF